MQYIYFDFDGTLADSLLLGVEIANQLAPKFGFKSVDMSKMDYYRTLSAQELLKEFKVSFIKLPIVAPAFKFEFNKRIDRLKPFDGIEQMLIDLTKSYKLGILTSNSEENVNKFLKRYQLGEYISEVRSELQVFGKHKSLKKIISRLNVDKKDFLYVGDETRDIEATKKIKISSIAVTWGINSENVLKKYEPTYIAHYPADIVNYASQNFSLK